LVLVHRCLVCGFVRPNRIADDPVQGDDVDAIIALMSRAGNASSAQLRLISSSLRYFVHELSGSGHQIADFWHAAVM
ncbi:MAG TPA: hypothetical protein VGJ50_25825, partial [Streptosporangiaceae bacterium]